MSSARLLKVLIPSALRISTVIPSALGISAVCGLYQISKVNPIMPVLKDLDEEKGFFSYGKPLSITPRSIRIEDTSIYFYDDKKMSLALVRAFYQLIPEGHKYFPSIFSGHDALFFNDYIMMVKINRLYKAFKDLGIDSDENQLMLVNILLVNGIQYPFNEEKSKDSDIYVSTVENSMRLNTKAWIRIRTQELLTKVDKDEIKSPTSNDQVRCWVVQKLQLLLKNAREDYESFPEKTKVKLKQALNGTNSKDALPYKEYENVLKMFYQTCSKNGKNHSPSITESSIPKLR